MRKVHKELYSARDIEVGFYILPIKDFDLHWHEELKMSDVMGFEVVRAEPNKHTDKIDIDFISDGRQYSNPCDPNTDVIRTYKIPRTGEKWRYIGEHKPGSINTVLDVTSDLVTSENYRVCSVSTFVTIYEPYLVLP